VFNRYFSTERLTDKSDVYSFGVVLLELICGRQPIDAKLSEDKLNIIQWVRSLIINPPNS
jgi:serine/threonine protein kinase